VKYIAGAAATNAAGWDIVLVQDEEDVTNGGQYKWFFDSAEAQATNATSQIVLVFSEIATSTGDLEQWTNQAISVATNADGFYISSDDTTQATTFLSAMKSYNY
jgi:hypothetical protein